MKKAQLILNLIMIIGILVIIWFTFQEKKIGYVDTIKLVQNFKGMKGAQSEIETIKKSMHARVDTLKMDFEMAVKDYEKKKAGMSPNEKKLTEQVLMGKQNQFYQYQQVTEKKIKEEEQRITQKVLSPVDNFIKEYAIKHNYQIVFGATGSGNIIYAKDQLDITDKIIQEINK